MQAVGITGMAINLWARGALNNPCLKGREVVGGVEFEDPEVGVVFELFGDVGVGGRLLDGDGAGAAEPGGLAGAVADLGEHHQPGMAAEHNQDAAGIRVPLADDHAVAAIGLAEA